MLLRLFAVVFVIYLGYRIARRFAEWLLGPPSAHPPRQVRTRRRRDRKPPEIEDAKWEDVS